MMNHGTSEFKPNDELLNRDNHRLQSPWEELKCQLRTSIPTTISFAFYKIPWLISLRFAGNMGNNELAAASMASTICNVTGMSIAVGCNTAISTLSGQARGEILRQRDSGHERVTRNSPILYLYRGIIVDIMLLVPVGMYFFSGISPFLMSIGQEEELASMTSNYLRVLTPGIWSYAINWTLTAWLQSLEMADIPAYAAFIGLITHVPFNLAFIYGFDWGYLGVAAATVMFQLIQPIMIVLYLKFTSHGRRRIQSECPPYIGGACSFKGIVEYLSLALPGLVVISEWWASESLIFLSAGLSPYPTLALAGMSIYQSINSTLFMFPIGASVGGTTRVANFLGMGNPKAAKRAAFVSVVYSSFFCCFISFMLLITPNALLPSFFTPDEDIITITANVIPLLALYVVASGIQAAFNGLIKACGRQCVTAPIVVISYWLVAIPIAYYLSFNLNGGEMYDCSNYFCGINGLVAGMVVGCWTHLMLLSSYVIFFLNWQNESDLAVQRIGGEPSQNYIAFTLSGDFPTMELVHSFKTPRSPLSSCDDSAFDFKGLENTELA